MATTRTAPPVSPIALGITSTRHRVDPMKLLDLIERVKAAAGDAGPTTSPSPSQHSAKAG